MNIKNTLLVASFLITLVNITTIKAADAESIKSPAKVVVLTGGWGFGKTTIINLLDKNGFITVPEVCTLLLNQAKANNNAESFWATYPSVGFSRRLMEKQLLFENSLDKNQCAFLDRSTIDVVAFANYENVELPSNISSVPNKDRYPIVFFVEPLPKDLFTKTEYGPYEKSVKLHEFLKKFYKDMGCNVIEVPFDVPEKRMEFILKCTFNNGL